MASTLTAILPATGTFVDDHGPPQAYFSAPRLLISYVDNHTRRGRSANSIRLAFHPEICDDVSIPMIIRNPFLAPVLNDTPYYRRAG